MSANGWLGFAKLNSSTLFDEVVATQRGDSGARVNAKALGYDLKNVESAKPTENGGLTPFDKGVDDVSLFSFTNSFNDLAGLYNSNSNLNHTNEMQPLHSHVHGLSQPVIDGDVKGAITKTQMMAALNVSNPFNQQPVSLQQPTKLSNSFSNQSQALESGKKRRRRLADLVHAPRPQNCFIIYRTYYQPVIKGHAPSLKNMEISQIASLMWHMESEEFQNYFRQYANSLKHLHQAAFPNFVYNRKQSCRPEKKDVNRKEKANAKDQTASSSTVTNERLLKLQQEYLDRVEAKPCPPKRLPINFNRSSSDGSEFQYEKQLIERAIEAFRANEHLNSQNIVDKASKTSEEDLRGSETQSCETSILNSGSTPSTLARTDSLPIDPSLRSESACKLKRKRGRPPGKVVGKRKDGIVKLPVPQPAEVVSHGGLDAQANRQRIPFAAATAESRESPFSMYPYNTWAQWYKSQEQASFLGRCDVDPLTQSMACAFPNYWKQINHMVNGYNVAAYPPLYLANFLYPTLQMGHSDLFANPSSQSTLLAEALSSSIAADIAKPFEELSCAEAASKFGTKADCEKQQGPSSIEKLGPMPLTPEATMDCDFGEQAKNQFQQNFKLNRTETDLTDEVQCGKESLTQLTDLAQTDRLNANVKTTAWKRPGDPVNPREPATQFTPNALSRERVNLAILVNKFGQNTLE